MNYLLHPRRTYAEWKERQERKCVVMIDNPPMRIKGREYVNSIGDPDFPTYLAFFGVPYATPPVGPLRFQKLQPPQPLRAGKSQRGPLVKAYKLHHASLQFGSKKSEFYGHEDCLYLNIYMLKKPEETSGNLPVLVYIHGGGFQHGTGDITHVEPDAIIRQNIIFVTINYRLCLLGFLNMGTKDCRGNAGLKDQVMALKWIRANIDRFGGDPYNITLSGHSAGGTCVNLHMISPLSEGLFNRAIVKGAGIHCPWGFQGKQRRPRRLLAQEYGLENELRYAIVKALKKEHPLDLLNIARDVGNDLMMMEPYKMIVCCGPSEEAIPTDAFIPGNVEELLARAKPIPMIAGMAAQEGYMYILGRWSRFRKGFGKLIKEDIEFVKFLRQNFRWNYETALRLKDTLRDKYFPNLSRMSNQDIQDQLATFCTDIWFRRFYDNFKTGQQLTAPLYVYKFWYIANHDQMRRTRCGRGKLRLIAPTHGDELNYLINPSYLKCVSGGSIPAEMKHVMDHMCSLWGSFCRNGIPTSEIEPNVIWKPHTELEPAYLNIGISSVLIPSRLHETRWQELNEIVDAESTEVSRASSTDNPIDFMGEP